MQNADGKENKVEVAQIAFQGEIRNGEDSQDKASCRVNFLASYPVNHIRDPWAANNRGKREHSHDNADIRFGSSMIENEERKKEKTSETGHGKKVGQ